MMQTKRLMGKRELEIESILSVGKVFAVKGRVIEILVDKNKNSSNLLYEGEIIRNVVVGSYLKIAKGFQKIVGKIDEEYITEDKSLNNKGYHYQKEKIQRILKVSLLGYIENNEFKQGIKELPLIDDTAFLLTSVEVDQVHNFIKIIDGKQDIPLKIGVLACETGKSISVGINSLFASHIGIFGNTGSGKSYSLASIYHKLFNKYSEKTEFKLNTKFLFIDFNGEYSPASAITNKKKCIQLSTRKKVEEIENKNKIPISYQILLNEELLCILAQASEKTQKPFIKRVIKLINKYLKDEKPLVYFHNTIQRVLKDVLLMVNKEKAFQLLDHLESIINHDNKIENYISFRNNLEFQNKYLYFKPNEDKSPITESDIEEIDLYKAIKNYNFPATFIEKLLHFFSLQLIYDLLQDHAQFDHIAPAISKLKSNAEDIQKVFNLENKQGDLFDDKNNICIIDLNDCNLGIKKLVPLIVSKYIYEKHKNENKISRNKYLNIIVDEAHNVLSYSSLRESETWKDYRLETFEEIIKEGRKFGVFLTIASQRPSDISDTIISQLHNYFLHRLINNRDIQAVERTISYLDKVSFDSLPILPTGTCIIAGLSAKVPVIVNIDKIEDQFEPHNKTIRITDHWG